MAAILHQDQGDLSLLIEQQIRKKGFSSTGARLGYTSAQKYFLNLLQKRSRLKVLHHSDIEDGQPLKQNNGC